MKPKGMISLAILAGVPFVMVLGNSMLIPVLPKMKSVLNITPLQTGLIITLFSIPAGLTIPFAGLISDRLSRKWIIVPALAIYAIGGLVSAFSGAWLPNPYWFVILGRIIQGIGAAGTAPIAMALASDIFTTTERSKALGFLEGANGMGKVLSPILGALVGLLAWYAPFFVYPVLCVPIAIALWVVVKEPKKEKTKQSIKEYLGSILSVFKKKGLALIAAFAAGMVVLFILFGVLFFYTDVLEKDFKIDGLIKGFIIAIPVLAMSLTSIILGTVFQKKMNLVKISIVSGLVVVAGSLAAIGYIKGMWPLLGVLVVMGVGTGFVLPALNLFITSSTSMEERGMVTALYGGVRFIGVALGPPIFAYLLEQGRVICFLCMAAIPLATAVFAFFFIKLKVMTNIKGSGKGDSQGPKSPENKKAPAGKEAGGGLLEGLLGKKNKI